jgi:dGTPase
VALRAEGEAGLGARKGLPGPIVSFNARWPLELATWPGLEAQLAALADDIAYLNHDLDDSLRAGLLTIAELAEAPLAGAHVKGVIARHGELELSRFIGELIRTLMSELMEDVLAATRAALAAGDFADAPALRAAGKPTAQFSPALMERLLALKQFQAEHIYRHPHVVHSMTGARQVVTELFAAFSAEPALLPPDWAASCGAPRDAATGSVARDYIAGMTDRYALAEYRRIFHRDIDV